MSWLIKILRAIASVFSDGGPERVVFVCCASCDHKLQCRASQRCLGAMYEAAREADTPVDKPKPGVK